MTQNLGDEKVLAIPELFACYETKPNALACARNEKVACSSQVTSSTKTAGFSEKSAVFPTFWGGLKAPKIGLALIWRYFPKNSNFERLEFTISLWNREYRNTNSIQSSFIICVTFGLPFITSHTFTGDRSLPISSTVSLDIFFIFIFCNTSESDVE